MPRLPQDRLLPPWCCGVQVPALKLGWAYVEPSWVCLVPAIELGELGVQQRAGVGASWHSQLMQRSGRIQGGDCNAYWSRSRHAPRSTGQLYASVPLRRWSLRLPDVSPALIEGGFNPRPHLWSDTRVRIHRGKKRASA